MFHFKGLFGPDFGHTLESRINPANGLPMIDGLEIDIAGNLFGTDSGSSDFGMPSGSGFGICGGLSFDD